MRVDIIAAVIIGLLVGFGLGRIRPKNLSLYQFLKKLYINLDNFILLFSSVIVIGSIYFSSTGRLEDFSTIALNVFGSVVFSWLLTKKSSKIEFKQQEEELALRSFRHINYIESAANTAYKKIEKYLDSENKLDNEAKLMLSSAMDQIKYIQGGINTCKMDWHDMLSDAEKQHYRNITDGNPDFEEEYGKVEIVLSDAEYNQEDA